MLRSDIINYLIERGTYNSYLEIGYGNGETFHKINIPLENKVGIDEGLGTPQGDPYVIRVTSDHYFAMSKAIGGKKFDIIFIDGSHLCEDVEKDLENSLLFLNEGGAIVMHDCNPPNIHYQERSQSPNVPGWCGDTWKAFVKFRATRPDIEMCVVDTDYGCGVVKFGTQTTLDIDVEKDLEYSNLEKNKAEWLNLISCEDFEEKF
jgi:hypothetical protein